MKRIYVLILPALFISCLYSQENRIPVEPSEQRLNRQHKPEQLMDVIGLEEGMIIADIGAGRGRMTVFFAHRVGEAGMVLANEINENALDYLEQRCRRNDIHNVKTYLGTVVDPKLPEGSADIVFMISTYHHLEKPVELIRNIIPALKPGGRLVIVERDPLKTGQTSRESTSQEALVGNATAAGFELLKIDRQLLDSDNIYFFTVSSQSR